MKQINEIRIFPESRITAVGRRETCVATRRRANGPFRQTAELVQKPNRRDDDVFRIRFGVNRSEVSAGTSARRFFNACKPNSARAPGKRVSRVVQRLRNRPVRLSAGRRCPPPDRSPLPAKSSVSDERAEGVRRSTRRREPDGRRVVGRTPPATDGRRSRDSCEVRTSITRRDRTTRVFFLHSYRFFIKLHYIEPQ